MKVYIYQLFHVMGLDTSWQTDIECGFFTTLPAVREYIAKNNIPQDDYECYRHKLNPEPGGNNHVKVKIFR